jgi:hypothetical protein
VGSEPRAWFVLGPEPRAKMALSGPTITDLDESEHNIQLDPVFWTHEGPITPPRAPYADTDMF